MDANDYMKQVPLYSVGQFLKKRNSQEIREITAIGHHEDGRVLYETSVPLGGAVMLGSIGSEWWLEDDVTFTNERPL